MHRSQYLIRVVFFACFHVFSCKDVQSIAKMKYCTKAGSILNLSSSFDTHTHTRAICRLYGFCPSKICMRSQTCMILISSVHNTCIPQVHETCIYLKEPMILKSKVRKHTKTKGNQLFWNLYGSGWHCL